MARKKKGRSRRRSAIPSLPILLAFAVPFIAAASTAAAASGSTEDKVLQFFKSLTAFFAGVGFPGGGGVIFKPENLIIGYGPLVVVSVVRKALMILDTNRALPRGVNI